MNEQSSKRDAGGSAAKIQVFDRAGIYTTPIVVEWNGQQPAVLIPLIGRKIERAWESGKTLELLLEDGKFLRINNSGPCMGDVRAVIAFEIGMAKNPANLVAYLDAHIPQNPYTEGIMGMTFTGADADVVMFGNYGARITPTGVEWVKVA